MFTIEVNLGWLVKYFGFHRKLALLFQAAAKVFEPRRLLLGAEATAQADCVRKTDLGKRLYLCFSQSRIV